MKINNQFEKEIKSAVINKLINNKKITTDTIIINELVIDSFSRRADLVIIEKDSMTAFEIKSEADSISRLTGQIDKYLSYFDKVIVVSAEKHISKISKTTTPNIGVWVYSDGAIKILRKGRKQNNIDKENYLDLLKTNEMKKLSRIIGFEVTQKDKKSIKLEIASNIHHISLKTIKSFVIKSLTSKYKMPSDYFKQNVLLKKNTNIFDFDLLRPIVENTKGKDSFFINEKTKMNEDSLLEQLAKESSLSIFGEIPSKIKKLI